MWCVGENAVVTCDRQTYNRIRERDIKKQGRIVHWSFKCNKREKNVMVTQMSQIRKIPDLIYIHMRYNSFLSNKLCYYSTRNLKKTHKRIKNDTMRPLHLGGSVLKMHWAEGDKTAEWRIHCDVDRPLGFAKHIYLCEKSCFSFIPFNYLRWWIVSVIYVYQPIRWCNKISQWKSVSKLNPVN